MTKDSLPAPVSPHSAAWVAQSWISFAVSVGATALGILYLPADAWIKGFLGMGVLFSIGSTLSLSKTVRDEHEAKRLAARLDDVKLQKILADHNPLAA